MSSELIQRIRDGEADAWQSLIDQYEGRLLAFVQRRISDRAASEDIVQETFVGFLMSLPNYDESRQLESYLFSICSYKLTDFLRKSGRRPTLPLAGRSRSKQSDSWAESQLPAGSMRMASSIARSVERQQLEQQVVAEAIAEQIVRWRQTGNVNKLKAIELLFVAGRTNQAVAERLGLTQQQVANLKSDFLTRLKSIIQRRDLDPAVFPELQQIEMDS